MDYPSDDDMFCEPSYMVRSLTGRCHVHIPFDIIDMIIAQSPNQQLLYKWQQVSFTTYHRATPLLYRGTIFIASLQGTACLLAGFPRQSPFFRLPHLPPEESAASRLISKTEALNRTEALVFKAEGWRTAEACKLAIEVDGVCLENLALVWFADDQGFRYKSQINVELVKWAAALGAGLIRLGDAYEPNEMAKIIPTAIANIRHTPRRSNIRMNDSRRLSELASLDSILQIDCRQMKGPIARKSLFKCLFDLIHSLHDCCVEVYGVGELDIGLELHQVLNKYEQAMAVTRLGWYPDYIGGGIERCQAMVAAIYRHYIELAVPHCQVELCFKLRTELDD